MSAPAVKPVLPPATAGGQATPGVPPAAQPSAAGNSPLKPPVNHSSMPLSLVQEKMPGVPNTGAPTQPSGLKTPEKLKEAVPAVNPSPKPTSNGVEVAPKPAGTPPSSEIKKQEDSNLVEGTNHTTPTTTNSNSNVSVANKASTPPATATHAAQPASNQTAATAPSAPQSTATPTLNASTTNVQKGKLHQQSVTRLGFVLIRLLEV